MMSQTSVPEIKHLHKVVLILRLFFLAGCKTLDAFLTKNDKGKSSRPVHSTATSLTPPKKSFIASLFEDNKLDRVGFFSLAAKPGANLPARFFDFHHLVTS